MIASPVNFARKFALVLEQWQPRVVAEMNDYQFKIARVEGDFVWHDHQDTDETFIVIGRRMAGPGDPDGQARRHVTSARVPH